MNNQKYIQLNDDGGYKIFDFNGLYSFFPPNTFIPNSYAGDEEKRIYILKEKLVENTDILKKIVQKGPPYKNENESFYQLDYEVVDKTEEEQNVLKKELFEKTMSEVRIKRNDLLYKSDWLVVYCLEKGVEFPEQWKNYRQDLRNITEQITEENILTENVVWPEPPLLNSPGEHGSTMFGKIINVL